MNSATTSQRTGLWCLLVLGLFSCRSTVDVPDLGLLYNRLAQDRSVERNPVIVIPGLMGSNLIDPSSGTIVWGAFGGDFADPNTAAGARLVALPMGIGKPLVELRDGVVENGALESIEVNIFGLPLGVNAYLNILLALGAVGGYRDASVAGVDYGGEHFTCFQFAYDWRRDIAESAAQLHDFVERRREYVLTEYAKRGHAVGDVRFDVVAHSMGGLVLRYYLRYGDAPLPEDGGLPELTWAGAKRVQRAVLVGTPNAGSMTAFVELLGGTKLGPFTPRYRPAIVGTMPGAYQLLPRARHGAYRGAGDEAVDVMQSVDNWDRFGWGLLDPDEARLLRDLLPGEADPGRRRAIARDHVAKCLARARQLHAALDVAAAPPPGTELHLAAGDAMASPAVAIIDTTTGELEELVMAPGDGTVLRSSALLDERVGGAWKPRLESPIEWEHVMFFFEDHLGLTKSEAFIDNLLYLLLEAPR